jgi:hypothetical protein
MLSTQRPGTVSSRVAYQQSLGRNSIGSSAQYGDVVSGPSQTTDVVIFRIPTRSDARELAIVELMSSLVNDNSTLGRRQYIGFYYAGGATAPVYLGQTIANSIGFSTVTYGDAGVAPTATSPALYGFTIRDTSLLATNFTIGYQAIITYYSGETSLPSIPRAPRTLGATSYSLFNDARLNVSKIGNVVNYSPQISFAANQVVTLGPFYLIGATPTNTRSAFIDCQLIIEGDNGTTLSEVRAITMHSVNGVMTVLHNVSFGGGTYTINGVFTRPITNATATSPASINIVFTGNAAVGGRLVGRYRTVSMDPSTYAGVAPSLSPCLDLQNDFTLGLASNGAEANTYSLPSLSGGAFPVAIAYAPGPSSVLIYKGVVLCINATDYSTTFFRASLVVVGGVATAGVVTMLPISTTNANVVVTVTATAVNATSAAPASVIISAATGGAVARAFISYSTAATIPSGSYII